MTIHQSVIVRWESEKSLQGNVCSDSFFCNPWKEYSIHETKTWLMSNFVTSTFLLPYEKCEIFSDLKGCFLPVKLTHPSYWRLLIDYKRTRSRFSRTKSDNGYMPLRKYRLDTFMLYSCLYYSEIDSMSKWYCKWLYIKETFNSIAISYGRWETNKVHLLIWKANKFWTVLHNYRMS